MQSAMDCVPKNEVLGEHVGQTTLSAEWIVQVSSLVSKQSRSLGFQVTLTTSAGCSEWCRSAAHGLSSYQAVHSHTIPCHREVISLKTGTLPEVSREMFTFGKMMKHGQSNLINWITISCKWRENILSYQTTSYSANFLLTEIFHSYIVKYCCCSFTRRWQKSTTRASIRLMRKRDLETLIHCMYSHTIKDGLSIVVVQLLKSSF